MEGFVSAASVAANVDLLIMEFNDYIDFMSMYTLTNDARVNHLLCEYFGENINYAMVHTLLSNAVYNNCKLHNFIHGLVLPYIQKIIDKLALAKAEAKIAEFNVNRR